MVVKNLTTVARPKQASTLFLQTMIFFFLLMTIGSRLHAADNLNTLMENRTLRTDTTVQPFAAIALDRMNVLYIGIDNPVSIGVTGASDDKIDVSVSGGGGAISKVKMGRYIVRVSSLTDDCQISVSVNGKPATISQFRVRFLPSPMATVGGYTSGSSISPTILASQEGVSTFVKDSPFELSYRVTGFRVTLLDDKNKVKSIDCNGPIFSPEAKEAIKQFAKSGDVVQISNITALDAGGRNMKIPALIYNIK